MMKKRLMIALCCLVLLVQLLPIVPMAETVDEGTVSQDLYYCRAALAKLSKGEALVHAYDNIVEGIDACAADIEISNDKYKLTLDEFKLALEAVRRDHTEQFWIDTTYKYTPDTAGNILKMHPDYLMTGSELAAAKVAFDQAIESMVGRLTPEMKQSEYEMEKALHDLLAIQVTYISTDNAHNAYGALVEGEAVCEGYAEALQCLLQRVGIQSIQVYGSSRNQNHAWNMVRIDGKYYLTDLTWDDQDTMLLYAYFNQTSAIFDEDHVQWTVGHDAKTNTELNCAVFDLPVCTATEANYFIKTDPGLIIDNYTVESIAQILKENDLSVRIFVKSDVNAFIEWFFKEEGEDPVTILAIADELGITGKFIPNAIQMGREVYIYFDTCLHEQLTFVAAKSPTCDEEGNTAYYVCQNKDCGKFFLTERDTNNNLVEIVNRDSINILSMGHDFTIKTVSDATLKQKAEKCTEHDTYFLTCSVCDKVSDAYTFETDVIGEHAYSETWEKDNVTNHKRVCANGCGVDITEAHDKDGEDSACSVCGYKFSIADLVPDIDAEETVDEILDIILSNPLILLGGGGSVVLLVIVVIIKKLRG